MVDRNTREDVAIRRWIAVPRSTPEDTENIEKKNKETSRHPGKSTQCQNTDHRTSPGTESSEYSIRLDGHSTLTISRMNDETDANQAYAVPALPTFKKSRTQIGLINRSSSTQKDLMTRNYSTQSDLRNVLSSHIEQQRNAIVSSYTKFVNSFTLSGKPFVPSPRQLEPRRVNVSATGEVTYRDLELLAILCVEEHNVPDIVVGELCISETGD